MNTISTISALSKSTLPHVEEAFQSIAALELPSGWLHEWHIQHDGDSDPVHFDWMDAEWIHYQYNGRHLGLAGTRNQALMRTNGEYIFSFDSDDVLRPNAFTTLIRGYEQYPDIVWAAGKWLELQDDGTTNEWRHPEYEGVREVGWIADEIQRLGQTPFNMNPLLFKRDAIVQAGGWGGPADWEDSVLLAKLSGQFRGWATDEEIGLYRRHAQSLSKQDRFRKAKPQVYAFLREVADLQGVVSLEKTETP